MRLLTTLIFISILWSCSNSTPDKKTDLTSQTVIADSITTTKFDSTSAPQEIYDFMSMVINEQKLHNNYGLIIESDQHLSIGGQDKKFLEDELIIKKEEPVKTVTVNGIVMPTEIKMNMFTRCLTKKDIDTMLIQNAIYKNVRWDNSRLGFDLHNDKNYYSFSIPVFSTDRTKAIIQIKDLCPGLCGISKTVLFKKENGAWTSETGASAYH